MSRPSGNEDAHPTDQASDGATSTQMSSEAILNSSLAALEKNQHWETVAAGMRKNWSRNVTFVDEKLDVLQGGQSASLVCIDVEELADRQNLTFQAGQGGICFVLTTDKEGTLINAETCRPDLTPKGKRRGSDVDAWWK